MALGISPREVARMTLHDLRDLRAYWTSCPPPHVLIAAYLGALKPEPKRASTRKDIERLAAAFGLPVRKKGGAANG
jgi:hypothetical protein